MAQVIINPAVGQNGNTETQQWNIQNANNTELYNKDAAQDLVIADNTAKETNVVQDASTTATDTSNFDNNLSAADDTVQAALETLDELVAEATGSTRLSCSNESGATIPVNSICSLGADVGSGPELTLNDSDDAVLISKLPVITLEEIADGGVGDCQHAPGVITGLTGLTPESLYNVSNVAGELRSSNPVSGYLRVIGQALTTTELLWSDSGVWIGVGAVDTTPPTIPANLSSSLITDTSFRVTWDAASDAGGVAYYLLRLDGGSALQIAELQYSYTNMTADTEYSITVEAVDNSGNASGQSSAVLVDTLVGADTEDPSVPDNVVATESSPSSISINWDVSTDNIEVDYYNVQRDSETPFVVEHPTNTYLDTGLDSDTEYSYAVQAVDTSGNLSDYSTPDTATTPTVDTTPPSVPDNIVLTATSSDTINVDWDASTDDVQVSRYDVAVTDGGSPITGSPFNISHPATDLDITGLDPSTEYGFAVSATDTSDNESAYSSPLVYETTDAPASVEISFDTEADNLPITLEFTSGTATLHLDGGGDVDLPNGTLVVTDLGSVASRSHTVTLSDPSALTTFSADVNASAEQNTMLNITGLGDFPNFAHIHFYHAGAHADVTGLDLSGCSNLTELHLANTTSPSSTADQWFLDLDAAVVEYKTDARFYYDEDDTTTASDAARASLESKGYTMY